MPFRATLFAIIVLILLFLFSANPLLSQPVINSISGTVSHKSSIVISGSEFGMKSPVVPLLWDDGEGNHILADKYNDYEPKSTSADYQIKYRSGTYRGMTNPHSHGTRYIVGGHEDNRPYDVNKGNSVAALKVNSRNFTKVYFTFYQALDPSWPTNGYQDAPVFSQNHKEVNYQTSGSLHIYDGTMGYNVYGRTGSNGGTPELSANINLDLRSNSGAGIICHDNIAYCYPKADILGKWIKHEEIVQWGTGVNTQVVHIMNNSTRTYANSVVMNITEHNLGNRAGVMFGGYLCFQTTVTTLSGWAGPDGNGEYYATLATDTKLLNLDKGATFLTKATVGSLLPGQWGYSGGKAYIKDNPAGHTYYATDSACGSIGGSSEHGGHADAYRYYDDVYLDNTWSRVMLANNSNYDLVTIVEPQIPSAWSNNSITVTVNLGRLPSTGCAYLFVFDENNNLNSLGFPVPIGAGNCSDSPPNPPANLSIQ